MHNDIKELACRVCGLIQEEPPWGDDGKTPNYEICPCCGVEFGYEDSNRNSVMSYRKSWTELGQQWANPNDKPESWCVEEQLENILCEFR